MSTKMFLGAAVSAMFIVGASTAFAGEVTGTGESLKPLNGKSTCAFSGLEDNPDLFQPGVVQSFGKHPNDNVGNGGVADNRDNIPNSPGPAAPGVFCNPSDPQGEPS